MLEEPIRSCVLLETRFAFVVFAVLPVFVRTASYMHIIVLKFLNCTRFKSSSPRKFNNLLKAINYY